MTSDSSTLADRALALQEGLAHYLAVILAQGLTAESQESLGRIRRQFEGGRAEIREQQTLTLKSNLPPPAKARALKSLRANISLLDSSLSQLDAVLQRVAA